MEAWELVDPTMPIRIMAGAVLRDDRFERGQGRDVGMLDERRTLVPSSGDPGANVNVCVKRDAIRKLRNTTDVRKSGCPHTSLAVRCHVGRNV